MFRALFFIFFETGENALQNTEAVQLMEEAYATVELRPCNAVTEVEVDNASVSMSPVPAGNDVTVVVDVATEDKNPVPLADLAKGLTLQLMAPGTKSRAAQVRGCFFFCPSFFRVFFFSVWVAY